MEEEVSTTQRGSSGNLRKRIVKYVKRFLIATTSFVGVLTVLNLMWQASGSGEWELEIDRNGVKVYSLKLPGYSVVQYKGVVYRSGVPYRELFQIFLGTGAMEDCSIYFPQCVGHKMLQPFDPKTMTNVQYWRSHVGFPFADREIINIGTVYQDPETKEVVLHQIATPTLMPFNDCCIRIQQMDQVWTYTPQEDGTLKEVYIQNVGSGGFIPDFLMSFGAEPVYTLLAEDIPRLLELYRGADELGWLEEY